VRSPRGGWLFTRNDSDSVRGGENEVCQRTRAYHLDTGSAYVIASCRPTAGATAGQPPRQTVTGGLVPAALLREAVWMSMLADRVTWLQVAAHAEPVPKGLRVQWVSGERALGSGCAYGPGAHAPKIDWRWIDKDKVHGAGTYRVAFDPGHAYAAHLLAVLEATFEEGRPTESLPVGEHWYPPAP
jgi:hypothetical protein